MKTIIKRSLTLAGSALLLPIAVRAQGVDARWQAWIGCWAPAPEDGVAARPTDPSLRICVAPAAGKSAVQLTTITAGQVIARTVVDADATSHEVTRDGCHGTESAWWSVTGRRVYLKSSLACADGTKRSSEGVLSFTANDEWLDVRSLAINKSSPGIAVARFSPVAAGDSAGIPAEVRKATPVRTPFAAYAVVAASSPLTLMDIAEVSTNVDSVLAAAWLVERTRGFTLAVDAKKLAALADHDVPSAVIDVAVALAYPDVFGIASDSREAQLRPGVRGAAPRSANVVDWYRGRPLYGASYDPCLWSLDPWYPYGGYGRWYDSRCGYYGYGYSGYGYGYDGYGYPYGRYGYYGGGYYYGGPTVVVITNPGESQGGRPSSHGRVVKGQGYTSGAGTTGPVARGGDAFAPLTSGGGSSSSSSGSSSSSSSSGSSGGGGRTAVRKP